MKKTRFIKTKLSIEKIRTLTSDQLPGIRGGGAYEPRDSKTNPYCSTCGESGCDC